VAPFLNSFHLELTFGFDSKSPWALYSSFFGFANTGSLRWEFGYIGEAHIGGTPYRWSQGNFYSVHEMFGSLSAAYFPKRSPFCSQVESGSNLFGFKLLHSPGRKNCGDFPRCPFSFLFESVLRSLGGGYP